MAEQRALVAHQFDDAAQQREAATFGMWLFLGTEVMLFGALFTAYSVYRSVYAVAFADASQHLYWWLGGINTVVLLTSSLLMALAVHAAQTGNQRNLVRLLLLTVLFGAAFLGIKATEYYLDYREGLVTLGGFVFGYAGPEPERARMFFNFYFIMTGLHAIHMLVGLCLLLVLVLLSRRGHFSAEYHTPVENIGLYWHFVDVVWVFLYPLLYLLRHP